MEREAFLLVLMRSLARDAALFILALLVFLGSVVAWPVAAPVFALLVLVRGIRGCINFRRSFQQYYAGISKWPPLSCEDCRAAQSKLKRKADKNRPRYF